MRALTAKALITTDKQLYLSQLTSLRGVACMLVLIGHVVQVFHYRDTSQSTFHGLISTVVSGAFNAEAAVLLFFVLSGCVLSLSLKGASSLGLRSTLAFYIKRIFRIYPLLWFAVGLAMVSMLVARNLVETGAFADWLARNLTTTINVKHTLLSLTGMYTRYNGPMWSLRIELIYSALFPAIFLIVRDVRIRKWGLGAFIILALLPLPYQLGLSFALSFAAGALIPFLSGRRTRLHGGIAIVALIVLLYDRVILAGVHPPERIFDIIETAAAFCIVRDVYTSGQSYGFLMARPIVWLGELSYGVYLMHLPVLLIVFTVLSHWLTPGIVLGSPASAQIAMAILTSAITIPLAAVTYNFIELPLHNIGRRLGKRVGLGPSSEPYSHPAAAMPSRRTLS
jgi:peptidoglycan/LPS O-acetylase OafA/YrhL